MFRQGEEISLFLSAYKTLPNYTDDKKPIFTSEYDCFFLTMWNMNYGVVEDFGEECENQQVNQLESKKTSKKTDMKIIKLLSNDPKLSITDLSTSLKISVSGVRYQIDKLKKIWYFGACWC